MNNVTDNMTESVISNVNSNKSNENMEDESCMYEILDDDLEEETEIIHDVDVNISIKKVICTHYNTSI